jgi:hypothetical protein
VTWQLVDWWIPAYRLAAEKAAPLDVAQQVVSAVGGLIESQPDGSVVCRPRWPVSIPEIESATVDLELSEKYIYAITESPTQDDLVNRVVIIDQDAAYQDRLEYIPNKLGTEDDPYNGILYGYISPWREGLRIVTTRPSKITLGTLGEGTRAIGDSNEDFPAETLTFTNRESSTQYPIMDLTSIEWLDENLGSVTFTPYSTTLTSGSVGAYEGHSLAKVQYTTRFLQIPVQCSESVESIEAQFLLLENTDG